jgi:TolB-like protein/Tfp pilus assembly protein PilF
MKRCPECKRDYYDDSLLYCLDDGGALLDGPMTFSPAGFTVGEETNTPTILFESVSRKEKSLDSIAVLPFVHLSSDADDEYFCDGLAEELLNAMTCIRGLKVAARTSSFSFKGTNASIGEIGRKLGVATVLEGSVRKSGNRLRITVQLIDTAGGYHLWSERFDREMRDIFDIQDEIALAVVQALRLNLIGEQRSALLKKGTENSEAYELYLRGRALWNSRTHGGFQKAIENFERAIRLDPDYALAYAALADCYSFLAYFGAVIPAEVSQKARDAVDKAISLDPGSAECRTAKAAAELFFEFDFDAAEREYLAAIAINPQYVPPHYLYCGVLTAQRRLDRAIEEGRTAVKMDPLSPHANTQLARALCCAGRPQEAIDLITKILEVMPDFHHLHWILGWAYGQMGRWDLSIVHHQTAAEIGGPFLYGFLGNALVKGGRPDEARSLLDRLTEQSKNGSVSPVSEAVIEAALGNVTRGLDLLDVAWEMRIITLVWIAVDPVFDAFRGEPRFKSLLEKLNLPE